LEICEAPNKIRIGGKATQGLGAGADPERGRRAVEEDRNAVYEALADADMVFVTAAWVEEPGQALRRWLLKSPAISAP
jgi:cell division protein FtsZ